MIVRILRPSDDVYQARNYKILFNKQVLGYLSAGEEHVFDVDETGTLQVKIDSFTGSKKIELNGIEYTLRVSGNKILSRSPVVMAILFLFFTVASLSFAKDLLFTSLLVISVSYIILLSIFRTRWLKTEIITIKG